ncbi:MAG: protein kinase domain-containing protein, partial [Oceanococcaceae bacterium]
MADWQRLEELFNGALDLPEQEWEAYLRQQTTEEALREEVLALLRQDASSQSTGIAAAVAASAVEAVSSGWRQGDLLGPYRILEHLADGGMGSVFVAERADGQYQQKVAIKSLKGRFASAALRERFLAERQILAGLDHPNIARMLDGGVDADGTPYIVMEFVDGRPLDRYCREEGASLEQRLRLIQKVCAAVQYAHNNLVVHRDIKPSNVLVSQSGEPKLLDFGIAKMLDTPGTEEATLTQAGQRMLTPEYASPEQIRGERMTTTSDVYSLGVVLYQTLSGRSPYERWRTRPLELQKAIVTADPERPSLAADLQEVGGLSPTVAATWKRRLRGDLDHIVLKAMRKEPAQRFSSPATLAEDIQCFLEGKPISARVGNWRYRSMKFLRRNRVPVGVASLVVTGVVSLVAFYTERLEDQRDFAQAQQLAAEKTSEFVIGLLTSASPDEANPDLPVSALLAEGVQRVEEDLAEQPVIAGKLLLTIGRAYWAIDRDAEGESLMLRGLDRLRSVLSESDPQVADVYIELADAMMDQERYEEALSLLHTAKEAYVSQFGEVHETVARLLLDIGRIQAQLHHDVSQERYAATATAKRILEQLGQKQSYQFSTVHALHSTWHKQRFEWAAAIQEIDQALDVRRRLAADGQLDQMRNAFAIEDKARLHYFMGDFATATPLFERVIRIVERYKGPEHLDMDWSLYYRGRIAREQGDHTRAMALFQRLVRQETATPQTPDRRYLARALAGLALVQADAGQLQAAQANAEQSLQILQSTQQKR